MTNTSRKFLLMLCAVALALPFAGASERAETLRAINWVENPTNHTRRGARGELGPYQFMPETWRLHTRTPFGQAIVREQSDAVAVKHYEWIKDGLREAGIDPNPFNIALAWNCGLGAVRSGRVPAMSYAYAERVQNLVEQQRARRAPVATAVATATTETATKPALPTPAPMFDLNLSDDTPRFVVATTEPLYEPTVYTEKAVASPVAPTASAAPVASTTMVASVEKPMFTIGSVAAPRFALIR